MITQEMIDQLVPYITERVMKELEKRMTPVLVSFGEKCGDYTSEELLEAIRKDFGQQAETVYVLQSLSLEGLSRLAMLQGATEEELKIQKLLETGRKIYILKQGRQYAQSLKQGKYGMKEQIRFYEQRLYSYGAEYLSLPEKKAENQQFLTARYITKKQLLLNQYQRNDTLYLSKNSRLTDCAKEWIEEQKIIIRKNV